MPKCDFIEITFRNGCSPVNLLYILRTPFPKNTSGRLYLTFTVVNFYLGIFLAVIITIIESFEKKNEL